MDDTIQIMLDQRTSVQAVRSGNGVFHPVNPFKVLSRQQEAPFVSSLQGKRRNPIGDLYFGSLKPCRSAAHDQFVRRPTGVIEKLLGEGHTALTDGPVTG